MWVLATYGAPSAGTWKLGDAHIRVGVAARGENVVGFERRPAHVRHVVGPPGPW